MTEDCTDVNHPWNAAKNVNGRNAALTIYWYTTAFHYGKKGLTLQLKMTVIGSGVVLR